MATWNSKIHFDLDGLQTACGFDLREHDIDTSDCIKEVTCQNCKSKWSQMKKKWEKELKKDKNRERRR